MGLVSSLVMHAVMEGWLEADDEMCHMYTFVINCLNNVIIPKNASWFIY